MCQKSSASGRMVPTARQCSTGNHHALLMRFKQVGRFATRMNSSWVISDRFSLGIDDRFRTVRGGWDEALIRMWSSQAREGAPFGGAPGWTSGETQWLVHYLMMTAVQEQKAGRGVTSLGADLGGSYAFFREGELRRQFPGRTAAARRYLELIDEATGKNRTHEHPKVSVTAERAYRSWLRGEKTLVFCFNIKTTQAVREAIERRIVEEQQRILSQAFDCKPRALRQRLKNFQRRMYDYRQSVFLLFQDYPLAGPKGRLPASLCLRASDLTRVCERLAATGPPRDRARFDRRRIIAAAEQVLVLRWSNTVQGRKWLEQRARRLDGGDLEARILSSKWISDRRKLVEE